jgi:hypothetical protein
MWRDCAREPSPGQMREDMVNEALQASGNRRPPGLGIAVRLR